MKLLSQAAALIGGLVIGASALAQSFPDRPIRLIVPFPPGGGTDIIARELGVALNKTSGWNLVAENRPGRRPSTKPVNLAASSQWRARCACLKHFRWTTRSCRWPN